jgi:hypothetical protein
MTLRYTLLVVAVLAGDCSLAQDPVPRGRVGRGGRAAMETPLVDASFPMPEQIKKPEDLKFKQDSFTFVRVRYSDGGPAGRAPRGTVAGFPGGAWATDFPESERNFLRRFQQVTQFKTAPEPKVLALTDLELVTYPFLYLVEAGRLRLTPEEAQSLRSYLQGGGFLLVDDFWGDADWQRLAEQFKQVFPERAPQELDLSHPIFHSFYDFKELPKVLPLFASATNVAQPARFLGIANDQGRLTVLFCHNNDLGDGWEREPYDADYAREYSHKRTYPMGINIVVYVLQSAAAK